MKKQTLVLGGVLLLTILLSSTIFSNFLNKNTLLDNVTLKENISNDSQTFAIMVENDDGEYVEYTDSDSFPTSMVFNATLSSCIDNDGNTIDNALSYSDGNVVVSTSQTSFCYVYFDIFSCEEGSTLSSCLVSSAAVDSTLILHEAGCDNGCAEDGKYRYSGESDEVNNYVCFGTSDLDECLADTDTYLFRIIEVDPDMGNVKLIKSTSYGSYRWNGTDGTTSTAVMYDSYYNYWAIDDTLYATLATTLNTTYLESFETYWQNIIETYNWNISGGDSSNTSVKALYDIETSETATFKIGLMNAYDYGYAADSSYWTLSGGVSGYSSAAAYDWLFLANTEWTIGRSSRTANYAFRIGATGNVGGGNVYSSSAAVRPSFYLTSNVIYLAGSGKSTSPYILSWN